MDFVPKFPEIEEVGIYLRGDGFYGPQEFSRWPQIYTPSLSHYSVIPKKPSDIMDKFWGSILFRDFNKDDWDPITPLPEINDRNWTMIEFSGGLLHRDLWHRLNDALEQAITSCLTGHEEDSSKLYALARALRNLGRCASRRLHDAPDCASQVIFAVRDVQRICLELLGIYEWMTVIRPHLQGSTSFPPGQYIGCFTSKVAEVEMLYHARIPVWYLRTKSSVTTSMDLGKNVSFSYVYTVLSLDRWKCVNGSSLHSKEIKDGGLIRDCTGLVYDEALSAMMEKVKSYCLHNLNSGEGPQDEDSEQPPSVKAQKRKFTESVQ